MVTHQDCTSNGKWGRGVDIAWCMSDGVLIGEADLAKLILRGCNHWNKEIKWKN